MLRDGRHDARAPLLRARKPANAIGNEQEDPARLALLRPDAAIQARRVHAERAMEARDEKMIGVRASHASRMRDAEHVDFGDRRALLERGIIANRGIHVAFSLTVCRPTIAESAFHPRLALTGVIEH